MSVPGKSSEPIIGLLNEHTLHLTLKHFLEPDSAYHEVLCDGFVADILRGDTITEIETRSFVNLRKKLPRFLSTYEVTVVYPIAVTKWVIWIDPKTGVLSDKHKSPKRGRPSDVARELHRLSSFLTHPRFRLKLVLCDMEEFKRLDGWSRDGKRGATREERVPIAFHGTIDFVVPEDYAALIDVWPEGDFTAAEFAKLNRLRGRVSWYILQILQTVGVIIRSGKRGNAFLYRRL